MTLLPRSYWLIALVTLLTIHSRLSAARLFSGQDPSIVQEIVYVLSNSSSFKPDKTSKTVKYSKNISFLPDSPAPPPEGLQGILYSQNDSCDNSQNSFSSNAPVNVTHIKHIALLSLNDCTLEWKINRAQRDLAVGAIIYDDKPINVESLKLPTSIAIPVVIVSSEVGQQLFNSLIAVETATTPVNTTSHWSKFINLTILPYQSFRPGVWELALIIGLILIASSITIFVIIRLHKRWQRQNHTHRNIAEKNETTVLEKSCLDIFPVRQWCSNDYPNRNTKETIFIPIDDIQPISVVSNQGLNTGHTFENQPTSANHLSGSPPIQHHFASQTPLLDNTTYAGDSMYPVCSICLDDFCEGDLVKRLPCQHDFHLKCADVWLTTRCNRCPLCKAKVHDDSSLRGNTSNLESGAKWYHIRPFTSSCR
ncbi:hypothetical protein K7432_006706 [Basidiobolus ranarum]|uniref:RING-type domain-containing protein n=1 Tax=Basidiobolus ranarum TaxID=34480 RepID=A0ABR2WUG6_9FUNG